ncbi:MAG: thiamine pyrophosphate-binding protein [Proteobacteria bacterium]|nr:thiamine pyrophosphate-binding protein [Pseudomonadota bacterium]
MSTTSVDAGVTMFAALESLGVTHVFGMPGTQTVPLFEALRRSRLVTVVPTHELAASFMAGAFFRAAGRPAVLLTIPGPGFAYALAGLAEARLDSAAMIYLVPACDEGPDARFALQAIPQTSLASSLAKAVLRVDAAAELAPAMHQAYALATSGEPGPVVVMLGVSTKAAPQEGSHSVVHAMAAVPTGQVEALTARVATARRPVIFAGQGCIASAPALQALVERLGAPLLTTPSARGVVPEDHPLAMGFDTHRGTVDAVNALLGDSDLVLVLGAHLGHNGTSGHHLKFDPASALHVDSDPAVLGRACPGESCVCLPVETFLHVLAECELRRSEWSTQELQSARQAISTPVARAAEPEIAGMPAARFFAVLRDALPREAMLVTDTGMHQVMTRRHLPILSPGGLLIPSDFQSMGFGLPAMIAAKLALPQRPVVGLMGDGGLSMSGMELATAAHLGLTLPIMVFDDGKLNQIRLHQQSAFGTGHGVDLPDVDFEALAAATGVRYAEAGSDLPAALATALAAPAPTLLRVPVGDSFGVRRVRATALAKATLRRTLPGSLVARLRRRR